MSWPKPQLQEFCRIIQGGRSGLSGNDFVPEGIPAYGAGGLNGYLPTHEFDEPAVILSSIGARCGKCFYADGKWASLANTQLIFPDATKADVRFLWIQLNDESRWHRSGTGQPFIKPSDVKAHRVLLPPLAEQRRIAEVLDRAEALRAKRRAALAQLDSLTQSIFLDLFGDPGSSKPMFPVMKLGDVAVKITDGEHQTPKRTTAGIKLLSARNIRDGFIDTSDVDYVGEDEYERIRRRCDPVVGDILISCSGTIGRVALVKGTEPLSLVRSVALVKPDRKIHEPEFMEHYLRTPAMKARMIRSANSSSQANLFQGPIRELNVFVPPLALQGEFALRVRAVEKLKATQRTALAELDALFATLQHRAFRGEL